MSAAARRLVAWLVNPELERLARLNQTRHKTSDQGDNA